MIGLNSTETRARSGLSVAAQSIPTEESYSLPIAPIFAPDPGVISHLTHPVVNIAPTVPVTTGYVTLHLYLVFTG